MESIKNSVPKHCKEVQSRIEMAVLNGNFSTYYSENYNKIAYKQLVEIFRKEGYKANLSSGEYSDGIRISWK